MKKSTWYRDLLVMLAALCVAGVAVVWVQRITGRIDGVAMLIFMLAVFVTSMYTDGYLWGVLASLASVLAVNFAFFTPYFAFNFTLPAFWSAPPLVPETRSWWNGRCPPPPLPVRCSRWPSRCCASCWQIPCCGCCRCRRRSCPLP